MIERYSWVVKWIWNNIFKKYINTHFNILWGSFLIRSIKGIDGSLLKCIIAQLLFNKFYR